jgi:hypothetical protein
VLGVAGSAHLDGRGGGLDLGQVTGSELDAGGADVLLQPLEPAGSGDWRDPGPLGEQPAQRDLRLCGALAPGDVGQEAEQGLVRLPVLLGEAGMVARMSVLANAVLWSIVPVRKPLPSGL